MPNPSFEDYSSCPSQPAQIDHADYWFQPLQESSTEYFNSCCNISPMFLGVDVPLNFYGYQNAKTGNAYGGILVYETGTWREYLEVQLINSLEPNKKYNVEFYYSLAKFSPVFIDSIGVYFSQDIIFSASATALPVTPQVYERVVIDSINWVKFSSSFTATGGEQFFLIGNFKDNFTQDGTNYSYIDDVSVILCEDSIEPPPPSIMIKVPNVFTPDNDGANDQFIIKNLPEQSHLIIYNRWGQAVLDKSNYLNNWDAQGVSAEVYYYVLTLPNGEQKKGFVQVIK